jgi:protein phosphatase slingshot
MLTKIYNYYSDPSHIIDNIYIGNSANARDYYNLVELKIGMVVNCASEIPCYFENEFKYVFINILDIEGADIYPFLDDSVDQIHLFNKNNPNANILVHCFMGASRSVSIVIAYLIKYYNYDFESALNLCNSKRSVVNVNVDFCDQLIKYEQYIKKSRS